MILQDVVTSILNDYKDSENPITIDKQSLPGPDTKVLRIYKHVLAKNPHNSNPRDLYTIGVVCRHESGCILPANLVPVCRNYMLSTEQRGFEVKYSNLAWVINSDDNKEQLFMCDLFRYSQIPDRSTCIFTDNDIVYDDGTLMDSIKEISKYNQQELINHGQEDRANAFPVVPFRISFLNSMILSSKSWPTRLASTSASSLYGQIPLSCSVNKGKTRSKTSNHISQHTLLFTPHLAFSKFSETTLTAPFSNKLTSSGGCSFQEGLDGYVENMMQMHQYEALNLVYPEYAQKAYRILEAAAKGRQFATIPDISADVISGLRSPSTFENVQVTLDIPNPFVNELTCTNTVEYGSRNRRSQPRFTASWKRYSQNLDGFGTGKENIEKAAYLRLAMLRKSDPLFVLKDLECSFTDNPEHASNQSLPKTMTAVASDLMVAYGKEHNVLCIYPWQLHSGMPNYVCGSQRLRFNKYRSRGLTPTEAHSEALLLLDRAIVRLEEAQAIYEQTGEVKDTQFLHFYRRDIPPSTIKEWLEIKKLVKALA